MVFKYLIGVSIIATCVLCCASRHTTHDELRRKRSPQEPFDISSNVFGTGIGDVNENQIPARPTGRPINRRTTTPTPVSSTTPAPGSPTTQNAVPGDATARTICEQNCGRAATFDPVCGTDGESYDNIGQLRCAQRCGIAVEVNYLGACP